jgi:hypothetical protein
VVARDGSSLSTQAKKDAFSAEIISWVQSKVANHKRLRGGCVINEAIPKSSVMLDSRSPDDADGGGRPTGKILRKNLRVMAAREVESEGQAGRSAKL